MFNSAIYNVSVINTKIYQTPVKYILFISPEYTQSANISQMAWNRTYHKSYHLTAGGVIEKT